MAINLQISFWEGAEEASVAFPDALPFSQRLFRMKYGYMTKS
jgi:hypothetical protein